MGSEQGDWTRAYWKGGVVLRLDPLCTWQVQVSVILCQADTCAPYVHPLFNPVAPYQYLIPTVYLFVADIANPDLFVCGCLTWICFDIADFYEEQCQQSIRSALLEAGVMTQFAHQSAMTAVTASPLLGYVDWSHTQDYQHTPQNFNWSRYTYARNIVANPYFSPRDTTSPHYNTTDTDILHYIQYVTNIPDSNSQVT